MDRFGLVDSLKRIVWPSLPSFSVFCSTVYRPGAEKARISLSAYCSFWGILYSLVISLGLEMRKESEKSSRKEGIYHRKCKRK